LQNKNHELGKMIIRDNKKEQTDAFIETLLAAKKIDHFYYNDQPPPGGGGQDDTHTKVIKLPSCQLN